MARILGIGNLVLDIILSMETFPPEDSELRAQSRTFSIGGNVANTLYVLNQLDHETSIVSSIGMDSESKQLLKGLEQRKIHSEHVQRHIQGQTPTSYVIRNQKTGSRTISHFRDLPETSFDFFAKIEIENYDWLHFEARNMEHLPGMLNIAKTFLDGQPISLEVEKAREGVEALFPQVNLIIFSHHYAKQKGFESGQSLLMQMKSLAPQTHMVCTWGEQGAWYLNAGENEIHHSPSTKVDQIVDTLGAGDTFNAGLIDALLQEPSLKNAVESASKLAARKCQQLGFDNVTQVIETEKPLANIKTLSTTKATIVKHPKFPQNLVLIKYEDTAKAYLNNCPHQDVPLNEAYKIDINPFEKTMKCSVHDAFFTIAEGICVEGPCLNDELEPIELRIDQKGDIYLT